MLTYLTLVTRFKIFWGTQYCAGFAKTLPQNVISNADTKFITHLLWSNCALPQVVCRVPKIGTSCAKSVVLSRYKQACRNVVRRRVIRWVTRLER